MVASWPLLIVDLLQICLYLDLMLVNTKKVHLYTPILKYLPKSVTRPIHAIYQKSLTRLYFCVLDKVDVNNTNFVTIFTVLTLVSILLNIFSILISSWHFYLMAIPTLFYSLCCMHLYKSLREMCNYCKFGLASQILWIISYGLTVREIPSAFKWVAAIAIIGSLFFRGIARKQKIKERAKKFQKEEELMFQ